MRWPTPKRRWKATDPKAMDTAREHLTASFAQLAEAMYKATPQAAPAGGPVRANGSRGGEPEKKKDEGVIDAE